MSTFTKAFRENDVYLFLNIGRHAMDMAPVAWRRSMTRSIKIIDDKVQPLFKLL